MKTTLKIALTGFLFFFSSATFTASAQRLYFCDSVSVKGDPIGLNQFFYIPKEGVNIAVLLKLPYSIEATEIELRFFKVDSMNNETYLSTVPFDVKTGWTWFWKSISFTQPAHYKVYAFADKERFVCSEIVDGYMKQP